jgi:hypothetical protein
MVRVFGHVGFVGGARRVGRAECYVATLQNARLQCDAIFCTKMLQCDAMFSAVKFRVIPSKREMGGGHFTFIRLADIGEYGCCAIFGPGVSIRLLVPAHS